MKNAIEDKLCIATFKEDFAFLSNFYESVVIYKKIVYPTVEHFFQAMKTVDVAIRKEIASCTTPGNAKRAGQKVSLRNNWETVKIKVMSEGIRQKFAPSSSLSTMLIATFPAHLEEGNWWGDCFWGVDLKTGKGANWLGRLLMTRRAELMKENDPEK